MSRPESWYSDFKKFFFIGGVFGKNLLKPVTAAPTSSSLSDILSSNDLQIALFSVSIVF